MNDWLRAACITTIVFVAFTACGNDKSPQNAAIDDREVELTALGKANQTKTIERQQEHLMPNQSELVRPVTQPPSSFGRPPVAGSALNQHSAQFAVTTVSSLQEAASLKDDLFAPTYIPSGLSIESIKLRDGSFGSIGTIEYGDELGRWLVLDVGGRVKEGGAYVKNGSYDEVTIAGEPAAIIQGGWVRHVNESTGQLSERTWNEDLVIQVYTQRGDQLVTVQAFPGTDWTRDEIFRIIESLARVNPDEP